MEVRRSRVNKWFWGAMEYLIEYQESVHVENGPSPITQAHWSPPQASQFKVNVDGSVFMHQKSDGNIMELAW